MDIEWVADGFHNGSVYPEAGYQGNLSRSERTIKKSLARRSIQRVYAPIGDFGAESIQVLHFFNFSGGGGTIRGIVFSSNRQKAQCFFFWSLICIRVLKGNYQD